MAGTYVAILTLFSISGGVTENWTSSGDTKVKEGIDLTPVNSSSGQAVYFFTGNYISLDGNPAIAFTGLPAGFELVSIGWNNAETGAFTTAVGWMGRGSVSDVIAINTAWGTRTLNNNCSVVSPTFQDIFAPTNPPALKVTELLNSLQFNYSVTANVGFAEAFVYKNLKGSGNYDIYLSVTTLPTTVAKGTDVKITAPSSLDLISTVTVGTAAGATFPATIVSETPTELHITWPDMGGFSGPALLMATEFGGRTYVLSPMIVILSDPSGLYQIVAGKTNDTLYLDHATTTHDVAIPNPFVKFGFIDG